MILNVDDYVPGLYARTKILRQAGFTVIEAATGKDALDLVASEKPSMVLLDVNLPDMSGYEVCRRIRATPEISATTIVHVSATAVQNQHLVHGLDTGADSYLVEPIDAAVLVATVKAFLRAREAEEALRRSNEDLGRFAYMVSHELNEPLRTITVHAQLLSRQLAEQLDATTGESLRFMIDGADRMRTFIDDLLRYSQATHVGRDIREVSLDALLHQTMWNLDAAISESGARITHDPLPTVVADTRIEHVLRNLFSNSIKYRRPEAAPEIHVSAAPLKEGGWVISVRDNGIGIDPLYQGSVFQIFRRLHGRDIPGTGIGLALSQRIVAAHGGRMWVESEPGVGSTFYFSIPQEQTSVSASNTN